MNQNQELEKRKEDFKKELDQLLTKYQFKLDIKILFSQYNILPPEIKLAMLILEKEKAAYVVDLMDIKKEDKK